MADYRVGIGIDAHAFAEGVPLVLGGVEIPSSRGLAGHSDGDVVAHALCSAPPVSTTSAPCSPRATRSCSASPR